MIRSRRIMSTFFTSAVGIASFAAFLISAPAGAAIVYVQYDGSTILSDPALVSATGSDFDVSANLQSGEFKGRAEGAVTSDQNAYAGSLSRLLFTNNTGGQVSIGAGDFTAHVQGDYAFGTGPAQSSQVSNQLQVRIGATTYIAASQHILATGTLQVPTNTFTKPFETNGASVALTTASSSQLILDLLMPQLTLAPGATMEVTWANTPLVNTDQPQILAGNFAEVDFFNGSNGMTLGLSLPSGVTLDSDSTVPLNWVTNVPIPGAVWLFGSALGLLGWMRHKKAS